MSLFSSLGHLIGNAINAHPTFQSQATNSLGSPAAWNKANPASKSSWEIKGPHLPGEVPIGTPAENGGIQKYAIPQVMRPYQPSAHIPFNLNTAYVPMSPTHRLLQQQMPLSFAQPSPDIQGAQRPGFIPTQGSRGVRNPQFINPNARIGF